jgi:hypothetical protein
VLRALIREARVLLEGRPQSSAVEWGKPGAHKQKPKKPKGPQEPWRRETIHGARVTFKSGVSPKAEKRIVAKLLNAYAYLKAMRFKDAWGGDIIITTKPRGSILGNYVRRKDQTFLYGKHITEPTIVHELGHRYWYRSMDRPRRLQFIAWVKSGLSPVSAYAKKDPWEAFAEAFKYFVLGLKMTPQQVETFKLVARGGRFESIDERKGKPRVEIFDFDGTLFKSPQRPKWYQGKAWCHDPNSLDPPCVPENPGGEWWNSALVQKAKSSISDPKTHTVLLTGRKASTFTRRVKALLKGQGLTFDETLLNPGTGTLAFKAGVLKKLLDYHGAQFVELWDDHPKYTRKFQSLFSKRGIKFSIKNTATLTHPAMCKAPEEG